MAMLFSPLVFCKVDHPKFFDLRPNYMMHGQDYMEYEFNLLGPINTPGWMTETPHESKKTQLSLFSKQASNSRSSTAYYIYIAGYSGYSNQLE